MKTRNTFKILSFGGLLCLALASRAAVRGDVIYVDADAAGANNGTSWANAYRELFVALPTASSGDEVRVAAGTYTPAASVSVTSTFRINDGIALLGGYAGGGAADPDERDPSVHVTTLDAQDVARHVILVSNAGAGTRLEGFVLTGGRATSTGFALLDNAGGGIAIVESTMTVRDCVIRDNFARFEGGGVHSQDSDITIVDCTFLDNTSDAEGGGFEPNGGDVTLASCTVTGNSARFGGGMYVRGGDRPTRLTAVNCIFTDNSATASGGAYDDCLEGTVLLASCTIYGNSADSGTGGVDSLPGECGDALLTIVNTVVWGNTGSADQVTSVPEEQVTFSCIQNWPGAGANGNIADDPLLVDPDGPDDILGTADDDLRLRFDSPCVDAGDNGALPADTADLDGDGDEAEPVPLDFAFLARRVDKLFTDDTGAGAAPTVDMGALESSIECGPLASGDADCDGSGLVDACEVVLIDPSLDCNLNGVIDSCEVFALLREATSYKGEFVDCAADSSYADAFQNYADNQTAIDDAFVSVLQAGKCLVEESDDSVNDVLFDGVYEKSVLELFLAQDSRQAAADNRFVDDGSNRIDDEVASLDDALTRYEKGIRTFLGGTSESDGEGILADFSEAFESFGPTRTPWDECAGDPTCCAPDPDDLEPYRETLKLAQLYAGQLATLDRKAELLGLKAGSQGASGADTIDEARQALIRGQARGFIGQVVLADQLPADRFDAESPEVAADVLNLNSAFHDLETRSSVIEGRALNALGVNPEFVQFIFFPERDPIELADPETPNNFTQWVERLGCDFGALCVALDAEDAQLDRNRSFESTATSFTQAIGSVVSEYDNLVSSLSDDFEATRIQIERNLAELSQAETEMANIFSRMQIEQDRVARRAGRRSSIGSQIASVFFETGEKLAANEIALGEINAAEAKKNGIFEALSSFSIGGSKSGPEFSLNPGQLARGIYQAVEGYKVETKRAELAASNQRIQAMEKVRVQYLEIQLENELEQIDSEAAVKSMLLEITNAGIGVRLKTIDLYESLSRLGRLENEIASTRAKKLVAQRTAERLYADPSFRLVRDASRERANSLFRKAQIETYLTARALEYEIAQPSQHLSGIFAARSATELEIIIGRLLNEWDANQRARFIDTRTISLRDDVLGFTFADVDPETGLTVDPIQRFRDYLRDTAPVPGLVFQVTFYGALNEWGPDKDNPDLQVDPQFRNLWLSWNIPRTLYNTKIQDVRVRFEGDTLDPDDSASLILNVGAHGWVRSRQGTQRPGPTETEPWRLAENIFKAQVLGYGRDEAPQNLESTVPVQLGSDDEVKRFWGLFNQSPVRKWELFLSLVQNPGLSLDQIDDIVLEVRMASNEL